MGIIKYFLWNVLASSTFVQMSQNVHQMHIPYSRTELVRPIVKILNIDDFIPFIRET